MRMKYGYIEVKSQGYRIPQIRPRVLVSMPIRFKSRHQDRQFASQLLPQVGIHALTSNAYFTSVAADRLITEKLYYLEIILPMVLHC